MNLYQYVLNPVGWVDPLGLANHFYSKKNNQGGDVFLSTEAINQNDFADLVDDCPLNQKVNVLTGTHGSSQSDKLYPEKNFYYEDAQKWSNDKNVNVIDVTTLSNKELKNILNSSDRSICAWCFSENSGAVKKAMNNKSSLLSIFTDPLKVK